MDNSPSAAVLRGMKEAGVDFVVSVPCVNLKDLILMVENDPEIIHVPVTREEEGVGVCAGAYMGGKRTAMLMQNSGLGNSINALASLNKLYGIPLLMIMSHRGVEGEPVCAQVPMGELTPPLLERMDIPFFVPASQTEAEGTIFEAMAIAQENRSPVAILFKIGFWRL